MSTPTISVILPAYRAEAHLSASLVALAVQRPPPLEVLVVDDGSPDRTAQIARDGGAAALVHPQNRGAAAARNTGARAARGDVLLFLDSDVVAGPTLIEAVSRLFSDPRVQAATGRYAPEPANDDPFARYKALWTWFAWEQTAAVQGQSGHLQGAICAVRRSTFLATGGFDEGYQGGNVEDYEYSVRLRAAGHTIVFDREMEGRHHFPGFGPVARNYWHRTRMWARLTPQQRAFSSGQANGRTAAASLMALGGAVAALGLPLTLPAVIVFDSAWLAATGPFLCFVARREGARFATRALIWHWSLGVVVGAAALSSPFGRGSRLTSGSPDP